MGLFNHRKPRGFHHEPMFIDTRKERLKDFEERTRRAHQTDESAEADGRLERGVFLKATKYTSGRRGNILPGGIFQTIIYMVLFGLLLVLVWRMITVF